MEDKELDKKLGILLKGFGLNWNERAYLVDDIKCLFEELGYRKVEGESPLLGAEGAK